MSTANPVSPHKVASWINDVLSGHRPLSSLYNADVATIIEDLDACCGHSVDMNPKHSISIPRNENPLMIALVSVMALQCGFALKGTHKFHATMIDDQRCSLTLIPCIHPHHPAIPCIAYGLWHGDKLNTGIKSFAEILEMFIHFEKLGDLLHVVQKMQINWPTTALMDSIARIKTFADALGPVSK